MDDTFSDPVLCLLPEEPLVGVTCAEGLHLDWLLVGELDSLSNVGVQTQVIVRLGEDSNVQQTCFQRFYLTM